MHGDPDDRTLRKVELEVLIPEKIRQKSRTEKCTEVVKAFTECGKAAGLLVVVKCRRENDAMKACLSRWYHDEDLKIQCTEEYLNERNEFRRTGVSRKKIQQAH
ncbi:COX assembly mitochondrial protein homolog isoform X2 [Bacillus rossius redtenbacheri]|uniref:COX assembly mitochondrial protein homolog isoform X2 n=1 Tax=Bacillus rossius redtenbacheri TaxID=93214 RepID=UPI002FDECC8C